MSSCESMKKGEVYVCSSCGFEIEVKKECGCSTEENCATHTHDHECCDFNCCGTPLKLKK